MTAFISIFEVGDYEGQIASAVQLLREGGVVVLPTETVYGAGGLLGSEKARARLQALRPNGQAKPFTIHIARPEHATRYIGEFSSFAGRLMRKLWPGPVGLIFDVPAERRREVAEQFKVSEADLYEDGAVTLRCPDHIVTSEVLEQIEGPVGMTLAGSSPQASAQHLGQELEGKVDLILDAGSSKYSKLSTLLHVKDDRYEILRPGVYDERIIERLLRTTILFVCSGNTCRSAMAEALAKSLLAGKLQVPQEELEKKGITVISAGSFAIPGVRATPQAVEAVRNLGADLSQHRSRPLTFELIHQADIIFTMSRSHASAVTALVPSAADKTVTLDPGGDIEDPIGGDLALYQQLAGQMQTLVEKRLEEKVPQL